MIALKKKKRASMFFKRFGHNAVIQSLADSDQSSTYLLKPLQMKSEDGRWRRDKDLLQGISVDILLGTCKQHKKNEFELIPTQKGMHKENFI